MRKVLFFALMAFAAVSGAIGDGSFWHRFAE